jgi:hypothetical protein
VLKGQPIAELHELPACILGCVGQVHPMMEVDLDFTPTRAAMLRQATHQSSIVLLGRIKIGMSKRKTVLVMPPADSSRVVAAPALEPVFLFIV